MKGHNNLLDRLVERMDLLDPSSVQSYLLRMTREKGFLEAIFDTIQEGIIVVDRALSVHYLNTAARQLLGIQENATNQRIDRYLREVEWGPLLDADPKQWERISRQEIEVFYPTHRYLSFYVVPISPGVKSETVPLATLIIRDVTQMHVDTEKTIESQKVEAITMLAAGVAHELGNPLNSLNIHLQLLVRCLDRIGAPSAPAPKPRATRGRKTKGAGTQAPPATTDSVADARELLDVAKQEVARLDAIVHHFLRAVRPVPPQMQPVDLSKLLGEVLAFMRAEIENRKIAVEASWPDALPTVAGDRDQLRQAFYNLIRNAVQAMASGGRLDILCNEDSNFVNLRFQDTGQGIAPENLSRILEPYFTTHAEGTGLGLLIVNRIVRTHGGELLIESVPGEGAAFTIRLPLRERQVRLLEAAKSAQEASIPLDAESRDTGG
ncbi:MAG: hypothetical protein A3K19_25140 [Lentisphaerae bacterium RIFOXYB12_FULL_65_16]|nr:MAG: hypothetical protein A3K18_00765 [Lentisphaerae bacterium RIFOXYA12_64_32]OGV91031.1 MAG: hypothetical protein A3K19_25140 [Lentisphaerae bacterium RIFOXYB12_FULL_65_16]